MLGIYVRTSVESETSILQQKNLGIQFSTSMNFDYQVYEDEGISGYEISDDDIDPFSNRPAFTSMINDIKNKKIDKVWVFEHSRISRNDYASAAIFNIFEKYNIELYENNKKLDLNDPQFQMMRKILDAVSQYERHLIINRMTRGYYSSVDKGKRTYNKFFGYENAGILEDGTKIWKPIEPILNQIKHSYEQLLSGIPIRQIIIDALVIKSAESLHFRRNYAKFLRHFEYTGYSLNKEGQTIYKKILSGEIDDVNVLNNEKYYIKSIPYPVEVISIDDWFRALKVLINNRRLYLNAKEKSYKMASKGLVTGLIECGNCGLKYYNWTSPKITRKYKKGISTYQYQYYKHHTKWDKRRCDCQPKSLPIENTDTIFKLFYFFNTLIFDKKEESIKESLFTVKQEISVIEERINKMNQSINKINKQLQNYNKIIDSPTATVETINLISKRILDIESCKESNNKQRLSLIEELDNLKIKFAGVELQNVYYDKKELVSTFLSSNIENMRNTLIKVIKKCNTFENNILIDTGYIIYLYDINKNYIFPNSLIEDLKKDISFKDYFIEKSYRNLIDVQESTKSIKPENIRLTLKRGVTGYFIPKNKVQRRLKKLNIEYEITEAHTNLISYSVGFINEIKVK